MSENHMGNNNNNMGNHLLNRDLVPRVFSVFNTAAAASGGSTHGAVIPDPIHLVNTTDGPKISWGQD